MTTPPWITDLQEKAGAATPGPWKRDGDDVTAKGESILGTEGYSHEWAPPCFLDKEDAVFVAAADPGVMAWLLAGLEKAADAIAEHGYTFGGHAEMDKDDAERFLEVFRRGPPGDKAARVEAFRAKVDAAARGPMGTYEDALALGVVKNREQYDKLAELRVRLHGEQAGPPTGEAEK